MKNSCEIICPANNYEAVIEVLERLRINYEDEYSIIVPPVFLDNEKQSKRYGVSGAILAGIAIYLSVIFLYWTQKISYPLNIGGRLNFDFVSSIPVIFEFTVLVVVVGMFIVYLSSHNMLKFDVPKDDKRIIYINRIYNVDLLKSKLEAFNVDIKYAAK